MNDPMVEEMKASAPSRWPGVIKRANILKRYGAIARPTVEDMERCAAELGCGRRQAYYYVRAWRARAAGLPDPRMVSSGNQGSDANDRPDRRRARVTPPRSPQRSGAGHRDVSDGLDAVRPTHLNCDVVFDCAPLSFDVTTDDMIEAARLLVVLDTRDGTILAHRLLPREARADDAIAVLQALPIQNGTRVSWTLGIGDGFELGRAAVVAGAEPVPPGIVPRPAGSAILSLIGPAIGRLKVMPRRRSSGDDPTAAVPIQAAKQAVDAIIAEHRARMTTP